MNVNRDNIDQHLFEYFEGDMSNQDADLLMDFIHQNPSFEKEFVQWKKAYHHVDEKFESFGINKDLKKIASTPFYVKNWFKIVAPTLFITISTISFYQFNNNLTTEKTPSSKNKVTNTKNTIINASVQKSHEPSISNDEVILTPSNKNIRTPNFKSNTTVNNKKSTSLERPANLSLNDNKADHNVDSLNQQYLTSLIDSSNTRIIEHIAITQDSSIVYTTKNTFKSQDSLNLEQPQTSKEQENNSKKGKKRKISRTTKALPINPNF